MWVIRTDGTAFNMDRAEMLRTNNGITEVMIGKTWWILSCDNIADKIFTAMSDNQFVMGVER